MNRILMTGAGGFLGSAIGARLTAEGSEIVRLHRRATDASGFHWDPETGAIDERALADLDGVIHLAGENIGAARWNAPVKRRILESRVRGTGLLCERLGGLSRRPSVLISASAVGFYGDRGDERLTEESPAGAGFLPEVCRAWEEATRPAADAGIRVVRLRIALVLSMQGGALPRILLPFRFGLGGRLGSGRQFMSWIALEDLVESVAWILRTPSLTGAVNAAAPDPVPNLDFTRALGRALHRPTSFAVPATALRLLVGEFAEAGLLSSSRAIPARLLASGFVFRHPAIEEALRHAVASARA